jgi:penicillin amidase
MAADPLPSPVAPPAARRRRSRVLRAFGLLIALGVGAAAVGALWFRAQMRASLPQLDGERVLPGLAETVTVERDALGVPTIKGRSRLDVARATGFVHAQERFFQMDLLRRRGAGELSELFGALALEMDRELRVHRLRDVARRVIAQGPPDEQALLAAYADGVNQGLNALAARPFEYIVLRRDARAWLPEDTVLVLLAMFVELHDERGRRESTLGVIRDVMPEPMFAFLAPMGTEWDAPLTGEAMVAPAAPGPDALDLRAAPGAASAAPAPAPVRDRSPATIVGRTLSPWGGGDAVEPPELGSNNWAVAGTHARGGRALLADDMHLGISIPNTWYRASLLWEADGGAQRITGVTLPGAPGVVVGSNGHVAWGFTNSQGDWSDLVVLESAGDPQTYRTPDGARRFERHAETIRVKGAPDETLEVLSTIWGPVVDTDHRGRRRALRWTAHDPRAVNSGLFRLETARGLDQALELANTAGIPPQNFVCADASGRIGWTIAGVIPRRVGFDGRLPTSWADGSRRWDGWLEPRDYPRLVDPPSGRIWTANARTVDGDWLARMGDGGYALGARARQIRDDLLALEQVGERELLAIQLDDRALFLERWRELLLGALTPEATAASGPRAELRGHVERWGGRASVDSVGYRAVRAFRFALAEQVFAALTARCKAADERFDYLRDVWQYEGPLWRLVSERPAHLLDPRHRDWASQLLAAADVVADELGRGPGGMARRTWGERNTAAIRHPLAAALPLAGRWLDMPKEPLAGDTHMPRVQGPAVGASERLVVSPGHEADGVFHMPVGQSGHPLSPHYGDGHAAWVRGEPTPFLPGPAIHVLVLKSEP